VAASSREARVDHGEVRLRPISGRLPGQGRPRRVVMPIRSNPQLRVECWIRAAGVEKPAPPCRR